MTPSNNYKLPLPAGTQEIIIGLLPGYIAGIIEPFNKIDFSKTRQEVIMLEHNEAIQKASLNGELVGRNPTTKIKQPFVAGDQLKRSILYMDELIDYLSSYGITVEVAELSINSGRYKLEDAAKTIGKATGESETMFLERFEKAVADKSLPVFWPGSKVRHESLTVREWYDEAYWDDLNSCLEILFPRLDWRFPEPHNNAEKASTDQPSINKSDLRVKEIGKAAKERFDNPLSIPYGGKSILRNSLCDLIPNLFTKDTFNKAWIEAKKMNLVEVENVEQYKPDK